VAVKAVVLDLDGTLIRRDGQVVPGVAGMMDELRAAGLRIAVAKGDPHSDVPGRLHAVGLRADLALDRTIVGRGKGAMAWVDAACRAFGIQTNELLWLGDSDGDMRSAVNRRVIYFHAAWSVPAYPYGIKVASPAEFSLVVRECFAKQTTWYWQLSAADAANQPVAIRSMIDGRGAGIPALKNDLMDFLHRGGNPRVGPLRTRDFIALHLLGSIYAEGLFRAADTWTVYPSSRGGPNAALDPVISQASKLFRDRYAPDLLVRHARARDTSLARASAQAVDLSDQADTVCLTEQHRPRIEDKSVLVIDDFTTEGYSLEWARNLLLRGGAREVVCVTIGKYGRGSYVVTARERDWDPYVPQTHPSDRFSYRSMPGTFDDGALTYVRESYGRVAATR
jgi:hypothetical protein